MEPNNTDLFIPTSKLIQLAKQQGINFGNGNVNERIRYLIKLGLLPNAKKKAIYDQQMRRQLEGHLPISALDQLVQIQQLQNSGYTVQEISNLVKKGLVNLQDQSPNVILPSPNQEISYYPITPKIIYHQPNLTENQDSKVNKEQESKEIKSPDSPVNKPPNRSSSHRSKLFFASSLAILIISSLLVNDSTRFTSNVLNKLLTNDQSKEVNSAHQAVLAESSGLDYLEVNTNLLVNGTINGVQNLVGSDNNQTLTNKSLSGGNNTFSNIPNSSLVNNSITINAGNNIIGGGTVSLGGSTSLAVSPNPSFSSLTLTSTSNQIKSGNTSITIPNPGGSDTLVDTSSTQTLTNKTLNSSTLNSPTINSPIINSATLNSPNLVSPSIALGGDSTGDIFYRNSSGVIARLAIGSANQVLSVISGLPSWQTSSGGGPSANPSLSNLTAVAINTSLLAGTNNSIDLGDSTHEFRTGYIGTSLIFGSGTTTTINFTSPTAGRTITLPDASGTVCLDSGNCTGVGAVTSPGGTANTIPKFTGAQTIGNSSITDNGSLITLGQNTTVSGTLSTGAITAPTSTNTINGIVINSGVLSGTLTTITPSGALTIGSQSQNLTLQGATTSLTDTSGGNTNSLAFATPSGGNHTLTLPNVTGNICTDTGNCLGGPGGGANTALSNLNSVAINLSLLPGSNNSIDAGDSTHQFRTAYLGTSIILGSSGLNSTTLSFTSPTAARTITFPNESGTVCTNGSVCAGYQAAGSFANTSLSNLASVAINTSLLPSADNSIDLGNGSHQLRTGYVGTSLIFGTSGANSTTFNFTSPTASNTITLPDASGTVCLSSGNCLGGGGGGANTALSNLTSVAINTSLLPGVDNSIDLGNGTHQFRSEYIATSIIFGTSGSNKTTLAFTAPSGANTLTLPNETGTICSSGSICSGYQAAGSFANTALSNLASVAINTSLLPASDNTIDLGNGTHQTRTGYFGTSLIFGTSGANKTTVGFTTPTAANAITLPDATGTVCLTSGNCAGSGGGVTTAGGTTNTIPKFTGSQTIGNSSITDNGSLVAVGETINISSGDLQTSGTQRLTSAGALNNITGYTQTSGTASITSTSTTGDVFAVSDTSLTISNNNLANLTFKNNNTGAGNTINGLTVTESAAASPSSGTNTSNLINLSANTGGTINGINFGSNLTNYFTGTNSTLTSSGAFSAVTGSFTGASSLTLGTSSSHLGAVIFDNATNGFTTTLQSGTATANRTITLPDAGGIVCTDSGNCLGGGSGGANTALSNLTSVAINTSLLPGSTTIDLGSNSSPFRDLYIGGTATNNFKLTGTGTAARVITIPDATGTVCLDTGNCLGGGGGGANTALSNLTSVAINTTLLPGTDNSIDLGSGAKEFRKLFLSNSIVLGTSGSNNTTLAFTAPTAANTITFPNETGTVCTTGSVCSGYQAAGSYANTALSNLASVAINTSLLPGSDNSIDLGNGTHQFRNNYVGSSLIFGTSGSNNTTVNFTSPTAANTITLPNATGTLCLTTGNCAGAGGGVTTSGGTTNTIPKFTGAQTLGDSSITDNGSAITLGNATTAKTINNVQNANQFSGGDLGAKINSAITAAAGGKVVITSGGTVTTAITLNQAGTTLECQAGVTLTKGANIDLITVTAANTTIQGCTIDGAQSSFTGNGITVNGVASTTIQNNNIKNNASHGIYLVNTGTNNSHVTSNYLSGNIDINIFGEKDAKNSIINSNTIDGSSSGPGGHQIAFHSTTSGKSVNGTTVTNNYITGAGSTTFCVEIGAFGGDRPANVNVSNNTCVIGGTGTAGGISFDSVDNSTVSSNIVDVNGNTPTIAGIEIVKGSAISVTGNAIKGGTTLPAGINFDQTNDSLATGNTVNGFSTTGSGIKLSSSVASNNAHQNTISSNHIVAPATGAVKGIWVQCNAAVDCSRNNLTANQIEGNGVASSNGITVERDSGTLDRTLISENIINNFAVAVNEASDTNTNAVGNQLSNNTTSWGGSAGAGLQRLDLPNGKLELGTSTALFLGIANTVVSNTGFQIGSTSGPIITNSGGTLLVRDSSQSNQLSLDTSTGNLATEGSLTLGNVSGNGTTNTGTIIYKNSSNSNTLTLQSGVTSSSYTLTLPTAQGGSNTLLQNNGSGVLSWVSSSGSTACSDCVFNDSAVTDASNTIAPTNDVTSLTLRQTSGGSPTKNIFAITNSGNTVTYASLASDATWILNSAASKAFSLQQGGSNFLNLSTAGALALSSLGTNQNISITPSGTGSITSTLSNTSGDGLAITNSSLNTAAASLANFTFKNNNTSTGLAINGLTLTASAPGIPSSGTNTTNFLNLSSPALTQTTAVTNTLNGINLSSPGALVQNTAAGTITWNGAAITSPAITQTTGTITSSGLNLTNGSITTAGTQNGLLVTTGSNTTAGTQNGVNVAAAGVTAGTLVGVNVSNITGGAGTETGVKIGTGWDTALDVAGSTSKFNSSQDGSLGSWSCEGTTGNCTITATNGNALPATRRSGSAVTANGYAYYLAGGNSSGTPQTSVYYSKINGDGTTGAWSTNSSSGLVARVLQSSVTANGYVYIIGGEDTSFVSRAEVYYAKLNSDGSVGTWTTTSALPQAVDRSGAVVANGYVYVVGGANGNSALNTVYYAKINADGTLGAWSTNANNITARDRLSVVTANGYIYTLGGETNPTGSSTVGTTQYAQISADGSVGSWTSTTSITAARFKHTSVVANGYVYVIGGSDTSNAAQSTVYYAKLNSDGTIGSWSTNTNALTQTLTLHSSIAANGYVYNIAGTYNGSTTDTTLYASTARVSMAADLDLVGLTSGGTSINAPSESGGSIYSGSIFSNGNLQVSGNTLLNSGAGITGPVSIQNSNPSYTLTVTDPGRLLDINRNLVINSAGKTLTVNSALASLTSNCTQTAGTCTDSANLLSLTQSYASATGALINISNSSTSASSISDSDTAFTSNNSSLESLTFANANTGAGVTVNGLTLTANAPGVPSSGTNTSNLINLSSPALTQTTAVTNTINGLNLSAPGALVQNTAAGTINWRGLNFTTPNITQTTGTVTSNGLSLANGSITTAGTQNLINLSATGVGAGTLNGINIAGITGGAGTENALTIGSGWDTSINVTPNALTSGSGINLASTQGSVGTLLTGNLQNITYSKTYTGTTGSETGSLLNLSRAITMNNAGQTLTTTGALVSISDTSVATTGVFSNSSVELKISSNVANQQSIQISNSGGGTLLDLNSPTNDTYAGLLMSGSTSTTNCDSTHGNAILRGLLFLNTTGVLAGHICVDNTNTSAPKANYFGTSFQTSTTDVAENYSDKTNALSPTEVVSLDPQGSKGVIKASKAYDQMLLGVISTEPGINLSGVDEQGRTDLVNRKPVALSGRVPVKFSAENGAVNPGDFLTSSATKPGFAMKATQPGRVIGMSLSSNSSDGTALVFVHLETVNPSATLSYSSNGTPTPSGSSQDATFNSVTANVATFQTLNVGSVKLTFDSSGNLKVNGGLAVTGNVSIAGNITLYGSLTAPNGLAVNVGTGKSFSVSSAGQTPLSADQNGTTVNNLTVSQDAQNPANNSIGSVTVNAGQKKITINTSKIKPGSKVLITFGGDYSPATRYWVDGIVDGKSFDLNLDLPVAAKVTANWWIVN